MSKRPNLEVRIAETEAEIREAQQLRFRMFYEAAGATPPAQQAAERRDFDVHDDFCDHMLVIAHLEKGPKVVGIYRLLRGEVAEHGPGFISAHEFDLRPLRFYDGSVVELGRACVDPAYRSGAVMQLLWRGIADYIVAENIDLMFGCASFPGTNLDDVKAALSHLHYHHSSDHLWTPKALSHLYIPLKQIKKSRLDARQALMQMPPLIKGYLRLGGIIGDGAVLDTVLKSIDVLMMVETASLTGKYRKHYIKDVSQEAPSEQPLMTGGEAI